VLKSFLIAFVFISSLFANKVIYLSYDKTPQRVIKGEIFTITLKTLSTVRDFDDIHYEFSNHPGVKILDEFPQREEKGKYLYDTFHLLTTSTYARLPDVNASLIAQEEYNSTIISGKKLNVIALNPKRNFSNIIANQLVLVDYKTTSYDNRHNIVVFVLAAQNADLKTIHFENVFKQGIESLEEDYENPKVTYFVVIDKRKENFTFSYFNLLKNQFVNLNIPIVVIDDSVTTQSDLKPHDQSHDRIKMYIAASIALIGILLLVWRRKYVYLVLVIFPAAYIAYLAIPQKEICIKKGSQIHLLPVENGTIFETTKTKLLLQKEGSVKHFIKVKLQNNKIGWVKNEDTCTY